MRAQIKLRLSQLVLFSIVPCDLAILFLLNILSRFNS